MMTVPSPGGGRDFVTIMANGAGAVYSVFSLRWSYPPARSFRSSGGNARVRHEYNHSDISRPRRHECDTHDVGQVVRIHFVYDMGTMNFNCPG